MDQYFVVTADGKEFGPVDLSGLHQWVKEGRVLKSTLIKKGAAPPVAAESLLELAEAFSPVPALPPATPPLAMTVALPAEFKSWDFIGKAWEIVKPHWLTLSLMFLIMALIGGIPGGFIIAGAVYVGMYRVIVGVMAGKTPEVSMMFDGFDRLGQALLASLVVGILTAIGTLFCIVPGVILSIMWMFVYLVLAETQLDFWAAMKASADLTEGYKWNLFCLALACFCVALLGTLVCCVGIFPAQAVIFTAMTLAYRFLQAKKAGTAAA